MNKVEQIDGQTIRDNKIFQLLLLGWTKTKIAEELGISRTVVSMVCNSAYGQAKLREMYSTVEQPLQMLPALVGHSLQSLERVLDGELTGDRAKTVIDAAKLVLGAAARFKELDRDVIRNVSHINDIKADTLQHN